MSTPWSPKCTVCNEHAVFGYEANLFDVREMIKVRDALAAIYPHLLVIDSGSFICHPLTGSAFFVDMNILKFFAKHAGHPIRPVNMYGSYADDPL